MNEPEDPDGFPIVLTQCLVGFFCNDCLSVPFSQRSVCLFQASGTLALLPGQLGFTATKDSPSETRDGCYLNIGIMFTPACFLACLQGVSSATWRKLPHFFVRSLPFMCILHTPAFRSSCVHWLVSCTHHMLGDVCFVGLAVLPMSR